MSDVANDEIRFLGDMVKLSLAPGDVVVLMTPNHFSRDERERLNQMWKDRMGETQCLVLEGGLRLGVLSPPPEEPK